MGEVGHLPSSEQPHRALSTTLSYPFLQFLGNLIQKGNAKRIYTTVLIENGLYLDALLDTGSEISLMCTDAFAEVTHMMQSTGRCLQVEACDINITSYTQDQAPITQRAWLEFTFQEMKIAHPVYISTVNTERLLIGQDLLDRLAPLIDCHLGQLWAQVTLPKAVSMGTSTHMHNYLPRHRAKCP